MDVDHSQVSKNVLALLSPAEGPDADQDANPQDLLFIPNYTYVQCVLQRSIVHVGQDD